MRATLLLATLILIAIAHFRPPEYDEAYSIFLTAGDPRPPWPATPFHPSDVRHFYTGQTTFAAIAQNLRTLDVHPPLYFWALNLWRRLFGPSWFTARLLSILFSLATLATLSQAAKLARIPVIPTLLITLLAYAFPYTSTLARNFALAQLLNTAALTLIIRSVGWAERSEAHHLTPAPLKTNNWRLTALSGLLFSLATFTNDLAIFTPLAILLWFLGPVGRISEAPSATFNRHNHQPRRDEHPPHTPSWPRMRPSTTSFLAGLATFLPLDAYFFAAQHASRAGQFPPFHPLPALGLIAKDSGAAIFGGLPLYAAPFTTPVAAALLIFFLICLTTATKPALFTLTALATPIGLFLLGLIFNNTPIEVRYVSFSIPSLALILATLPKPLRNTLILLESLGTFGLAFAPSTMQPQALAAREAAALSTPATLTLIPYGNDGVGIPGPFIEAAPGALTIRLIKSPPPLTQLPPHIILATITADDSSRATIAATLAALAASPCWRRTATTPHTQAFQRICTPH
jgi:hypothetical protein